MGDDPTPSHRTRYLEGTRCRRELGPHPTDQGRQLMPTRSHDGPKRVSIFYRGRHRIARVAHKMRRRVSTMSTALIGLLLLTVGFAVAGHGTDDVSVEVPDKFSSASATLSDGSIVSYIGDSDLSFGSAGSGIFESYVQIQANPTESGYNTDGTKEFDTGSSPNFNHSILLSEIPVVDVGGLLYWEFFVDINDSNANNPIAPQISLDDMELYLTADPNITGYPFSGAADLLYEWQGHVRINDVNQGSGRGDLRYLVPLSQALVPIPAGCDYGNPACTTYLVHYSFWGGHESGDYASDSGFEEWKVKRYPILQVSKDISGTFETPVLWTIDKTADASYDAFIAGSTPTHDYIIDVEPIIGAAENAAISGTITIEGDEDSDVDAMITDLFEGTAATIVSCSVPPNIDGTYTIVEDGIVTCGYTHDVGTVTAGENEARASIAVDDVNLVFRGFASIEEADYTAIETGELSINVTDDDGTPADTGDDRSFGPFTTNSHSAVGYTTSWVCPSDPSLYTGDGMYDFTIVNTAVIDETGQDDDATVVVTCHAPVVSKTADGSSTDDITWTIDKGPNGDYDLLAGDSVNHQYVVSVDETITAGSYRVGGSVTVVNSHPTAAMLLTIVDELDDMTSVSFLSPADCTDGSVTVPADSQVVCEYSVIGLDGDESSNSATVTFNTVDFGASSGFTFIDDGTPNGPDSINVSDDNGTPGNPGDDVIVGSFGTDGSAQYSETFSCPTDVNYGDDGIIELSDYVNTASITETGQSDDATVSVTCYAPNVSKDAQTRFDRTYDWAVLKRHDAPDSIVIDEGQSFLVNYDVVASLTGWSDSQHGASGTLTVANPHPTEVMEVAVGDTVLPGTAGVITGCSVAADPDGRYAVPAGGSITCSYDVTGLDATATTNRATATLYVDNTAGVVRTGDATLDWSSATITEIDESIDVTDEATLNGGTLGVESLGTVSVTGEGSGVSVSNVGAGVVAAQSLAPDPTPGIVFEYSVELRDLALECGMNDLDNTATITTNDLAIVKTAAATLDIDLACFLGCSLTQGYWKTHNATFHGGAPHDDTWLLIEPDAELTGFFLSGQNYYDVMWTPPQGNVYYNLAHQYIAVQLNLLTGADPTDIQAAFDEATALLEAATPEEIDALKGKDRKEWNGIAGDLADYNEGEIGPGHCDEDGNSG